MAVNNMYFISFFGDSDFTCQDCYVKDINTYKAFLKKFPGLIANGDGAQARESSYVNGYDAFHDDRDKFEKMVVEEIKKVHCGVIINRSVPEIYVDGKKLSDKDQKQFIKDNKLVFKRETFDTKDVAYIVFSQYC